MLLSFFLGQSLSVHFLPKNKKTFLLEQKKNLDDSEKDIEDKDPNEKSDNVYLYTVKANANTVVPKIKKVFFLHQDEILDGFYLLQDLPPEFTV